MEPQPPLSPASTRFLPESHSISENVKELVGRRGAGNSDSQKHQDEKVDSSDLGPRKGCRKCAEIPRADRTEKSTS